MHRWVRPPERERHRKPTEHEALEYGAALVNLYALKEGRQILGALDGRAQPEVYFFEGLACLAEWDHAGATRALDLYLSQPGLEPYRRLLGQVNLGLALLLARQWDRAREVIDRNVTAASDAGARLLWVNSLECRAHLEYLSGTTEEANRALDQALEAALDPASGLRDVFYIEKWRVLLGLRKKRSKHWLGEAARLQARARAFRDFETARSIDFHLGRELGDPGRLARVYYGSPFESYRARIEETVRSLGLELPETWVWRPGLSIGNREKRACVPPREVSLIAPWSSALSSALTALSADHYRPQPLVALYERIYPGSHFNPTSSRDQIHQTFRRLRTYWSVQETSLVVRESRGTYWLEGTQPLVVRKDRSHVDDRLRQAQRRFGMSEFGSSLLAELLNVSKPTAVALLRRWTESGVLTQFGAGPKIRYRFADG